VGATVVGLIPTPRAARRRTRWWIALGPGALGALAVLTAVLGFMLAITGGSLGCTSSGATGSGATGARPVALGTRRHPARVPAAL